MPLLITFKNSDRSHVIKGEDAREWVRSEWAKGGFILKHALNDHELFIRVDDVQMVEHIPIDEWNARMKERAEQESKNRGQKVEPKMMIPEGRRRGPS